MDSRIRPYLIDSQPYYQPVGDEVELFEAAYRCRIPMILKGPTGCGKTRFVEYMAWHLGKPLVTIACNEDLSAGDLIGRYLLDASGTVWHDGPLTTAVRYGAICYLDEVVEARADTTVVIHPLSDARRTLPLDRRGELIRAHPDFQLVLSYNPGYQSSAKDLKASTRQRFGALDFHYPDADTEIDIVVKETGLDRVMAQSLVKVASASRTLDAAGAFEAISTRMLVRAAALIVEGVEAKSACRMALIQPASDDDDVLQSLQGFVDAHFGIET
jgi:nitric oxide reductase NorQ protein